MAKENGVCKELEQIEETKDAGVVNPNDIFEGINDGCSSFITGMAAGGCFAFLNADTEQPAAEGEEAKEEEPGCMDFMTSSAPEVKEGEEEAVEEGEPACAGFVALVSPGACVDGTVDCLSSAIPSSIMGHSLDLSTFSEDGFSVLRGFASPGECDNLKGRMKQLIEKWDPVESKNSVFTSNGGNQAATGDYFIDSAQNVSFFLEQGALRYGKPKKDLPKEHLINKVGHALHTQDAAFNLFTMSSKMKAAGTAAGLCNPVVPQSMYCFKPPKFGGQVMSHQDASFFFTEPKQTVVGVYLALDDQDESSGCLWVRKGSQNEDVRRRFVRNDTYFRNKKSGAKPTRFETLNPSPEGCAEGRLPADPASQGYEAVPVKKGDVIVLNGQVDYCSYTNEGEDVKASYVVHMVEGGAGVEYSERNWLQYKDEKPFPALY